MEELDELDEIFRETRIQTKNSSDAHKDFGIWISFEEWRFRRNSAMFDSFRSKHGMRPVDSKKRELELKSYLEGLNSQINLEDI